MSGRPAFSFVSQCPYAQFTRNDTVVSQSSVDNEGKGREKKENVSSHPRKLCRRYAFHTFLCTPFQPSYTFTATRKLVQPLSLDVFFVRLALQASLPLSVLPPPSGPCVPVTRVSGRPTLFTLLLFTLSLPPPTSREVRGKRRFVNLFALDFCYCGRVS